MTSRLDRRLFLLLSGAALTGCGTGLLPGTEEEKKRARAAKEKKKKRSKTREIGIELWAGAERQPGTPFPTVNTVSGRRRNRFIRGPITWTNPRTDQRILAYERIKRQNQGTKRQILAISQDGQGLGRVFDSRANQPDRHFEDEVIFPLGVWSRGERRDFEAIEHTASGPELRKIRIKIRRLDYTYRGAENSLRYDWTSRDASGKLLFRERYIYSPGEGLVKFEDLTKRKRKKKKKRKTKAES
ncbi:MAG: hypothetical protein AAGI13_05125 [Pseudomonadota bacterium]